MFNLDAARQSGWSDDAIFDYLAQTRGVSRQSLGQSGITQPESLAALSEVDKTPTVTRKRTGPLKAIAKTFAPLGETFGAALGASGAADTSEQIAAQQQISLQNLVKAYKQAKPGQKPRILKQLSALGGVDVVGSIPEAQKTTRQVIGEAGVTGLSLLSGGLSGHGLGLKTAGARIATDTALGGAFGLSRGLERNLKGRQLILPTAASAAIAGTISGAFEGISRAIQKGPERLFTSTKSMTRGQLAKNPGAPAEAIREGLKGGYDDMYQQAVAYGDKFEDFIGSTVKELDKRRGGVDFFNELVPKVLKHKESMLKGALYPDKLNQAYDNVLMGLLDKVDDSGVMTHAAAQELKRGLNQQLKGSFMRGLLGQGEAVQAERGVQSALRSLIAEHADDIPEHGPILEQLYGVKDFNALNKRYGANLALQEALESKAIQQGTNNLFSINDAPTAILGSLAGNAVAGGTGAITGGAGLAALRKALGTTSARTYLAQALASLRTSGSFEKSAPWIQNLINQVASTQTAIAPR